MINQIYLLIKSIKYKPLNRYPLGHFYSPIISKKEFLELEEHIWEEAENKTLPGINLNSEKQISLIKEFEKYYDEMPFEEEASPEKRYCLGNNSYGYTDAIMLYSFIRHFNPKNVIEIGSGFSSALMLDTKDIFKMDTNYTFIEPYPKLLNSLLKDHDKNSCKIYKSKVQKVPIEVFNELEVNDILFIDSSHVSKAGSDVNFELFNILPSLKSGVIIHFHDVFYPFEYPKEWITRGRNWNEDYLLRAFLSYNNDFEILLFSHYIHEHFKDAFKNMPLTYKCTGGNLWLRKK
ncbi:class I SAM-dependent methyltransferase [Flavivirga amylovorans]|uniref:Class I SAM-dependent methyltransferase n=1 Tax=Flavivirga amylovorans TaxID=870486 RepID=A0ABT8WXT7_9FLAO|nr:class I SAM-dependent methyltransferase [Flavivirga amylovorans]MDO5986473.1 class I SAM-dependent methyltransferase [Flavivirga amylovorans]